MLAKLFNRGITYPSSNWVSRVQQQVKNTPDLWLLENYSHWLTFVCDDLKTGHRRHDLLEGSELACDCVFSKPAFSMFNKKLGKASFPVPILGRSVMAPYSVVKGQLWRVPTDTLKGLDIYRNNTVEFQRTRISVAVPYKEVHWDNNPNEVYVSRTRTQYVRAWMYVGRPQFWDDLIDAGMLFSKVRQGSFGPDYITTKGRFYEYTYAEYFDK